MNFLYPYYNRINLYVEGRIPKEDALRQEQTARAILQRLKQRPGVILADEVGMGKTFVALAVAVSVALENRGKRPVVVMVPSSLKKKWPRDFETFQQKCLPESLRQKIRYGCAERAIEFLKLLDDPPQRQKQILFVTHGAMSRNLSDKWVKLAIIAEAIKGRHGVKEMRKDLTKVLADLLYMHWVEKNGQDIWLELLRTPSREWLRILHKWGIDPENDDDPDTDDDPVPEAVENVLQNMDMAAVFKVLEKIPRNRTGTYKRRLKKARNAVNKELRKLWQDSVHQLDLKLPLLILDEAHHLKNPNTRLAGLFYAKDAEEDADQIARGPLSKAFERMLFLTATPFQLGHAELCSVLERFDGIKWHSRNAPGLKREGFKDEIKRLRLALDAAQSSAVALDTMWGRLKDEDLQVDGKKYDRADAWWRAVHAGKLLSPTTEIVCQSYTDTQKRMREAEKLLKPWVIRHLKPRMLPAPNDKVSRRCNRSGEQIVNDEFSTDLGLSVEGEALLPFLLAARATTHAPVNRPVFAEGLASSYEAFLHTRSDKRNESRNFTDGDDDAADVCDTTDAMRWYLEQLEQLIPRDDIAASISHPKVNATVKRVVDLWKNGEKVVVFCHYIATGKVLRQQISEAIGSEIQKIIARKTSCSPEAVEDYLEKIGKRFFDEDSPIRRACDNEATTMLEEFSELADYKDDLVVIFRRYARTPSFLARYFPLGKNLDEAAMKEALATHDSSGLCLADLLKGFFRFLVSHCSDEDRKRYIEAVMSIQTGSHFGRNTTQFFDHVELPGERVEKLLPNVRLVNGATKSETRQRLMLTFNTPFYPEILVTSNVLAEGVDLHLNCRYIIHHDLCWNPSTLEQRTGRVDRIGAKSEQCGKSIHVYLPYIAETQDEKMYRVVMDRERWFSVVMGEKYKVDARTVEKLAQRIPFPEAAAKDLAFRLES